MSVFFNVILIVQLLSALGMIVLILVQHGKGADMGAAFGSGGSGSLFGASGSANFLSRSTSILAVVFFLCTLSLTYVGGKRSSSSGSVLESPAVTAPATSSAPAPASAPSSPASQIPGASSSSTSAPAAQSSAVPPNPSTPNTPASGAAQIPTK